MGNKIVRSSKNASAIPNFLKSIHASANILNPISLKSCDLKLLIFLRCEET